MIRRLLVAAALLAGLALPSSPEEIALTLPEARRAAVAAGLAGNAPVAEVLAAELLRQDPDDPDALLAMATVHLAKSDWDAAYRFSRRAFRFNEDQTSKFHAARVASVAALADKRLMHSQFWLRRAGDLAPSDVHRLKIERQFAYLRAETPTRYRFSFSASPSSNVNGGSDDAYNIIDGVPLVGILSGDAQALSGMVFQASGNYSYRFRETETSQTEVTAALFVKRVVLSEEAKAQAPGYDPARLGVTALDLGLSHAMRVGKPGTLLRFDLGIRDYWQNKARSHTAIVGGAMYSRMLGEKLRFTGRLSVEDRYYTNGADGFVGSVNAGLTYTFGSGSRLSAVLGYSESETPMFILDSRSVVGKITYTLGKPIKSVELSAGIGASYTDYPDYTLFFIPVPGGRQDEGLFMDIDATFTSIEFAGFSPSMKLRRSITESNVSRFNTSEWAVSVGIESNF